MSEHVRLRHGVEILIRPIEPEDRARLAETVGGFSRDTRYRRFFSPIDRLSEHELRYLTELDHHDHEALAAIDPEDGSIIGVARYIRTEPPEEAELAVAVTDAWQGRGVATALLERLLERARQEGVTRFLALVMSDNEDALDLFRSLAPSSSRTSRSDSGKVELVIELPEPGRMRESSMGRLLSAAARGTIVVNPWRFLRRAVVRGRRRGARSD